MSTFTGKTWVMTEEERRQFNHMQTDIEQIKDQCTTLGVKVDKMYFALMGNEIAKDGGLVRRIEVLETDVRDIKDQLVEIKADANKSRWHLMFLWGAGGAVIMSIFSYVLSLIFKH